MPFHIPADTVPVEAITIDPVGRIVIETMHVGRAVFGRSNHLAGINSTTTNRFVCEGTNSTCNNNMCKGSANGSCSNFECVR